MFDAYKNLVGELGQEELYKEFVFLEKVIKYKGQYDSGDLYGRDYICKNFGFKLIRDSEIDVAQSENGKECVFGVTAESNPILKITY